jgi:hypothetical protein
MGTSASRQSIYDTQALGPRDVACQLLTVNYKLPFCVLAAITLAALACNAPLGDDGSASTVEALYVTITAQANTAPGLTQAAGAATSSSMPSQNVTPTTGVTPTAPPNRSGNGNNLVISRCAAAVIIDAQDADWTSQTGAVGVPLDKNTYGASEWSGAVDLSGSARLCWNDSGLYLFVNVTDDVHAQDQRGETSWKGDEVEFLLDTDLRGDFYHDTWNNDDFQLGLSPGNFADLAPASYLYHPSIELPRGVEVDSERTDTAGSYRLEAGLLWEATLGMNTPAAGQSLGMCVALSDNDHVGAAQQDSMTSHCTGLKVTDPTTWITATLE